jgi:hypothetical protein
MLITISIRVMAGDFNATLTALKRLESRLPDGGKCFIKNSLGSLNFKHKYIL